MKIGEIAWTNIKPAFSNSKGPVVTIGIRFECTRLYITYSACSPKDQFSKLKARRAVEGRLGWQTDGVTYRNNGKVWEHVFDKPKDHILRSEALELATQSFLSRLRAGKIQIGWLKRNVVSELFF